MASPRLHRPTCVQLISLCNYGYAGLLIGARGSAPCASSSLGSYRALAAYDFTQGVDANATSSTHPGITIYALARLCSLDPSCKGFNTDGELKRAGLVITEKPSSKPCNGLYLRRRPGEASHISRRHLPPADGPCIDQRGAGVDNEPCRIPLAAGLEADMSRGPHTHTACPHADGIQCSTLGFRQACCMQASKLDMIPAHI